jgi:hypothetical protein
MHNNLFPDILVDYSKSSTLNTLLMNPDFTTSSFAFDEFKVGLKSTQQIKVDYSIFENHTFFNSAVAKTNLAFEKIINKFPYDGTKAEIVSFYDNLNGFEKYFIDNFPHNFGFIHFDSSFENHIVVNDFQGINEFSNLTNDNAEGKSVLSPESGSFSVEFHFKPPLPTGNTEVIIQKKDLTENIGYCVFVSSSVDPNCELVFSVFSGSFYIQSVISIPREEFSHVSFVFDNSNIDYSNIISYVNGKKFNHNISGLTKIKDLNIAKFNFLIGSGSSFTTDSVIEPDTTLSGSLDELRYFSDIRSEDEISIYSDRNVFASKNLKLYFKFNEPTDISTDPSELINAICLDSSGNSLHSYIENFDFSNRRLKSDDITSKLKNEKKKFNLVLFPGNSAIREFYLNLLDNGKEFDKFNPNLITKLIPKHYLVDGQLVFGTDDIEGDINDENSQNVAPGNYDIGNVQVMVSFLYTLASFYDDLKLFVDGFNLVDHVTYQGQNDAPDVFLDRILEKHGISLSSILDNKNFEKFFLGEYTIDGETFDNVPLKDIQMLMIRYLAVNIKNILSSKGTIDSLKYFIRSIGIDPENSMKLVEYGTNDINLSSLREKKKIIDRMIKFQFGSYIETDKFVAERIETDGPPLSNSINDNLLTSGSWSIAFNTKYFENDDFVSTDFSSLCRLYTLGSSIPSDEGCVLNLIASKENENIKLVFNPNTTVFTNKIIELKNVNIFDGERWNISFGREVDYEESPNSTKYFLKAGRLKNIDNIKLFSTSSFFDETQDNVFNEFSSTHNSDGIFAVVGNGKSQNITQTNFTQDDDESLFTNTSFRLSNFKLFTKAISDLEFMEHTKNPFSVGEDDFLKPLSYERLRMHSINRWNNNIANNIGEITFLDSTKNNIHINGFSFEENSKVLFPDIVYHTSLPTQIDETISENKIFFSSESSKRPKYDNRFEIQISLIDYLNDDIIRHLSSTQFLENAFGRTENLYDSKYRILENAKLNYFERLNNKLNFKSFKEIYDFISDSLDNFIAYLIPERTNFRGINYIIQSSILERHKLDYKLPDFYSFKNVKFVQQTITLGNSIDIGLIKGNFE